MASKVPPVAALPAAPALPQIQRASDIPQFCLKVALAFNDAPPFPVEYGARKYCKIIPLENYDVTRICDIFNSNANRKFKTGWEIQGFEGTSNNARDVNNQPIPQGVGLWQFGTPRCSAEFLESAYKQVLEQLATGWKRAEPQDHPKILHKQDPKGYDLFIKTPSLFEEDTLIRFIAAQLKLSTDICCSNHWTDRRPNELYLWVKKTSLQTFVEKTDFKLP